MVQDVVGKEGVRRVRTRTWRNDWQPVQANVAACWSRAALPRGCHFSAYTELAKALLLSSNPLAVLVAVYLKVSSGRADSLGCRRRRASLNPGMLETHPKRPLSLLNLKRNLSFLRDQNILLVCFTRGKVLHDPVNNALFMMWARWFGQNFPSVIPWFENILLKSSPATNLLMQSADVRKMDGTNRL